ncbi:MAG: hypothetical protein U0521_05580 [Anaerolineae bacterium]
MQIANIRKLIGFSVFVSMLFGGSVFAVSSASFVFDFVSDPGDAADGPDFNVTGVGPIDDGSGCGGDVVVMIMADATGGVVDIDSFCLSLISGTGGSDGDYGSFDGYLPVASPITYALFDLTAADLTALTGFGDNDTEYRDYILTHATCLSEQFLDETDLGIPTGTPWSLCGGGPVVATGGGCTLVVPSGSVVGEAPLGAQVFWAPGKESPGIVLNPGTYIVIGQDESETYYKVMLACQFVWVRKDTMQPSYQAPQNGAALPTRVVG